MHLMNLNELSLQNAWVLGRISLSCVCKNAATDGIKLCFKHTAIEYVYSHEF